MTLLDCGWSKLHRCERIRDIDLRVNRTICLSQSSPEGQPSIPLSGADNAASIGTCKTVVPCLYWLVVAWRPRRLPQTQSNDVCFTLFATILFSIQDFSNESTAKSALLFCIEIVDDLPLLILPPHSGSIKRHSTLFSSDECKMLQKSKQPTFDKGPMCQI